MSDMTLPELLAEITRAHVDAYDAGYQRGLRQAHAAGFREGVEAAAKMMERGSWHPERVAMVRALAPAPAKGELIEAALLRHQQAVERGECAECNRIASTAPRRCQKCSGFIGMDPAVCGCRCAPAPAKDGEGP